MPVHITSNVRRAIEAERTVWHLRSNEESGRTNLPEYDEELQSVQTERNPTKDRSTRAVLDMMGRQFFQVLPCLLPRVLSSVEE